MRLRGLFDKFQQPVLEQGSMRGKMPSRCELGLYCRRQEAQHQVHTGSLLGNVIVQIGVQPFVTEVHLYRQADEQNVSLKLRQPEELLETRQPEFYSTAQA